MQTYRTTLNLPYELIKDVQGCLGAKTKTEAIVMALQEILRRHRLIKMTEKLAGKVKLSITQSQLKKLRKSKNKWA